MLKVIAIIGAILLAAIVAILVIASRKPDDFRVTRSTLVQAPPEKNLSADRRSAPLGRLVALREEGSRHEADLQRRPKRRRRDL